MRLKIKEVGTIAFQFKFELHYLPAHVHLQINDSGLLVVRLYFLLQIILIVAIGFHKSICLRTESGPSETETNIACFLSDVENVDDGHEWQGKGLRLVV